MACATIEPKLGKMDATDFVSNTLLIDVTYFSTAWLRYEKETSQGNKKIGGEKSS